jgi:hypothetical protein
MNPALMEMMARTKMADLERARGTQSCRASRPGAPSAAMTAIRSSQTSAGSRVAVRESIGWTLVRVGLRLAVPQSHLGSAR